MPTTFTTLDMYNILREKIGDEQAQSIRDYVEKQVETKRISDRLATMENLRQRKMKAEAEEKKWKMYACITCAMVMILLIGLYFKKEDAFIFSVFQ